MTNTVSTAAPESVRRLTTPAALALADLAAIFEDLQTALRCCERLVAELEPSASVSQPDDLALEAFWTTTVLSYARCFAVGSRGSGLTEADVTATGLSGDVLGWHRILLQLCKHYGDPAVNPRESFAVGASQDPDGKAAGIAVTSSRQPLVDEISVRQTGAIAFELSRLVDGRISEHQQVVFAALSAMSRAELDKLPVLEVVLPTPATTPVEVTAPEPPTTAG